MDVDCDVMLNGRVLITIKLNEKLPIKLRVQAAYCYLTVVIVRYIISMVKVHTSISLEL